MVGAGGGVKPVLHVRLPGKPGAAPYEVRAATPAPGRLRQGQDFAGAIDLALSCVVHSGFLDNPSGLRLPPAVPPNGFFAGQEDRVAIF